MDMDMGGWSSACGAKALAAWAEPWPHILASRQLGELTSAQGVGTASRCPQRAGSTWGYCWDSHLVPCQGGNRYYRAHRGAEEEFHLPTRCWCPCVLVSCFRHLWISPRELVRLHTSFYKREADVWRPEMIWTGSGMLEVKTESKSLETMPTPQQQGHHSFGEYFPLTLAAFAAG